MLFMVIEQFKSREAAQAVYQRFAERGRMLPDGLNYIDSWIEEDLGRCFQLMETDNPQLFQQWTACWNDLVDFEIVPVIKSATAAKKADTPSLSPG